MVPLYIHSYLELTLLQPCSVGIKLFLALSYRELLPVQTQFPARQTDRGLSDAIYVYPTLPSLYDAAQHAAAINPPMHDRATSRPSVLN
jgi:hypothetical protein